MLEGLHLCLIECFLGHVDVGFVHLLGIDGLDDVGFLGCEMHE